MAKRVCAEPGCPTLTDSTRCTEHTRQRDKARGTRQARGYDAQHDRDRARWRKVIDLGGWPCARCPHRIQPGEPFHLDHTADRTGYLGPSHEHCNLSAAGKARHGISPRD
jgi:hypothetical protein